MSSDLRIELTEFHQFVSQKLASGGQALSPEEALDKWRAAHPPAEVIADDIAAVRETLDDLAAGDVGASVEEFDRAFSAGHGSE